LSAGAGTDDRWREGGREAEWGAALGRSRPLRRAAGAVRSRVGLGVLVAGGTEPVTSAAFVAASHDSVADYVYTCLHLDLLRFGTRFLPFSFLRRNILPDDVLSRVMACQRRHKYLGLISSNDIINILT
jgi:hypothetical protein